MLLFLLLLFPVVVVVSAAADDGEDGTAEFNPKKGVIVVFFTPERRGLGVVSASGSNEEGKLILSEEDV